EGEQGAGPVERIRTSGMLGKRAFEAGEGGLEVAGRGQMQPAAPRQDGQRPGPVERGGAVLPGREYLAGLVEVADRDQRLAQGAQLEPLGRFEHVDIADLVRPSQVDQRRVRVAEGQLDEAEYPAVPRLSDADAPALGPGDGALRYGARVRDPAPVGGD